MKTNIAGQVALITGAGRGIGEQIAYALAGEGCRLGLTALEPDELSRVAARCQQLGAPAVALPLDLRNLNKVPGLVDRVTAEFGGLNILVNNAAAYHFGPIAKAAPEHWDEMLEVNLRGAMRLTQHCVRHIIRGADAGSGRGAVIFVSSLATTRGFYGGAGYGASKRGLDGFAESLFEDIGEHGVKVCVIHPGWVNTRMIEWARLDKSMMIQPAEIAELVRMVAAWPDTSCPREIKITAQRTPRRLS